MSEDNKEAVAKRRFYNTTDGPITMDDEGHILGGFEHGSYAPTDQTRTAVTDGNLIDKGDVDAEEEEGDHEVKAPAETPLVPPAATPESNPDNDKTNKSANKGRTSGKVK